MVGSQIEEVQSTQGPFTPCLPEILRQNHQSSMVCVPAFSEGDYPPRFVSFRRRYKNIVPGYHPHGNGVTVMVDCV
jgi:hypothetical protein